MVKGEANMAVERNYESKLPVRLVNEEEIIENSGNFLDRILLFLLTPD